MKTTLKRTLSIATLLVVAIAVFTACGNKQQKSKAEAAQPLTVDSLMAQADRLVGQTVTLQGLCTHTCKHGAKKIFLRGSDDSQTLRIDAGELGAFDTACVNKQVRIVGTLSEERIDEAYLQRWEERLKENNAIQHGQGEAGCATEKNARQETADTADGRIADFRAKIAKRQVEEGKDYLSFYFVKASSYEIQ